LTTDGEGKPLQAIADDAIELFDAGAGQPLAELIRNGLCHRHTLLCAERMELCSNRPAMSTLRDFEKCARKIDRRIVRLCAVLFFPAVIESCGEVCRVSLRVVFYDRERCRAPSNGSTAPPMNPTAIA
jgi:hypothetical protein